MNGTNQEEVFQKILAQNIMMPLGDILGMSYEMGKRFQTAIQSQCYPVQQAMAAYIEPLKEITEDENESDMDDERECERELNKVPDTMYYSVNSREARSSRKPM